MCTKVHHRNLNHTTVNSTVIDKIIPKTKGQETKLRMNVCCVLKVLLRTSGEGETVTSELYYSRSPSDIIPDQAMELF
jgi:hypothetical protein